MPDGHNSCEPVVQEDLVALEGDAVAYWVQDVDRSRVLWANRAAHVLLQATSSQELYERDVSPLLPATRVRLQHYLVRARRGEIIHTHWTTFLNKGQAVPTPLPVVATIKPFALEQGRIGLLFAARDVSEHVCAEGLRMVELTRHASTALALFSQTGKVLERNAKWVAVFGSQIDEPEDEFVHLFAQTATARTFRQTVITKGSEQIRTQLITMTGPEWFLLNASIVLDPADGQRTLHVEATNITAQVKAEEQAKQSERLLQVMADEMTTPVCFVDAQRHFRFANRSYARWIGAEPEHIIGNTVERVAGAVADKLLDQYWAAVQVGKRESYEIMSQHPRRQGRWTLVDLVPHRLSEQSAYADAAAQQYGAFIFGYDIHEQKIAQEKMLSLEQQLIQMTDSIGVTIVQLDDQMRIRFVNAQFAKQYQRHAEAMIGLHLVEVMGDETYALLKPAIERAFEGETVTWRALSNHQKRWTDYNSAPVWQRSYSQDGQLQEKITGVVGIALDVHDQVIANERLGQAQELLAMHLQATPLAVVQFDPHRRITHWGGRAQHVFGWHSQEVFGRTLSEFGLFEPEQAARLEHELQFMDAQETDRFTFSTRNVRREGQPVYCDWYCSLVRDGKGRPVSYLALVQDISQRVTAEQHLQYLAQHDVLTGLANRHQFNDTLRAEVERANRTGQGLALAYIDLDKFKFINESLGQHLGDLLLKECAQRLQQLPYAISLARLSADEFAILLQVPAQQRDVPEQIASLHKKLNQTYLINGHQVHCTASCGVALYPSDATDEINLNKYADWALYRAKDAGRASIKAYAQVADATGLSRISLETDLRRAVERGDFELHYQAKQHIHSGKVQSAEALIRWRHPTKGLIPPDMFIGMAEELGLIEPIGQWVIDHACWQLAQWQAQWGTMPQIAVNLSAVQLKQDHLADDVLSAARRFGIQGRNLMVEVTESAVITDHHRAVQTLQRLRYNGVQCAIDDFGKGFSSLSQLRRLPIDALKIDGAFVRDVVIDRDDAMIVQAIIGLARNLGLKVVAEGVETQEQLQFLRQHACDEAQGYLLSRPIPAQDFAMQFLQPNLQTQTTIAGNM